MYVCDAQLVEFRLKLRGSTLLSLLYPPYTFVPCLPHKYDQNGSCSTSELQGSVFRFPACVPSLVPRLSIPHVPHRACLSSIGKLHRDVALDTVDFETTNWARACTVSNVPANA